MIESPPSYSQEVWYQDIKELRRLPISKLSLYWTLFVRMLILPDQYRAKKGRMLKLDRYSPHFTFIESSCPLVQ